MSFIREKIIKPLTRSKHWRKVRNEHLKIESFCQICGRKDGLEVHHIIPFHINPSKELEHSNLVTLCDKNLRCHRWAHGGNWKYHNQDFKSDKNQLSAILKKIKDQN